MKDLFNSFVNVSIYAKVKLSQGHLLVMILRQPVFCLSIFV